MSWAGGWGRAFSEAVSRPFTALTGIEIEPRINIGLKLPADLTKALENDQPPPVDLVWCNAVPAIQAMQNGWVDPLDEDAVPNLKALHPRARPEGCPSTWPFVLPYIVHYVLAYRTSAFPDAIPQSWNVLFEPRFRGKIALYPDGHGFHPIAQILGGGALNDIPASMEACWKIFIQLKPQIGRLDYSIALSEQIRRGELDLCFRALPNAIAFKNEGLDISWTIPQEGTADTMDALFVPKNLSNENSYWAKQLIDFALSRNTQENWSEQLGVMAVHPDAALPPAYRNNAYLNRSQSDFCGVLHLPEALKAKHEQEWEKKFSEILL